MEAVCCRTPCADSPCPCRARQASLGWGGNCVEGTLRAARLSCAPRGSRSGEILTRFVACATRKHPNPVTRTHHFRFVACATRKFRIRRVVRADRVLPSPDRRSGAFRSTPGSLPGMLEAVRGRIGNGCIGFLRQRDSPSAILSGSDGESGDMDSRCPALGGCRPLPPRRNPAENVGRAVRPSIASSRKRIAAAGVRRRSRSPSVPAVPGPSQEPVPGGAGGNPSRSRISLRQRGR